MPADEPADAALVEEVIGLLVATSTRMNLHFATRAAEFDLTSAEAKVLLALDVDEPLSMRAVARKLGSDPSNLTGVADRLEDRGLVTRELARADRRVKSVVPSRHGLDVREQLTCRLRAGGGPLASLSPDQLEQLRTLLEHANRTPRG